ncbi:MAG TPA: glycoside hydrolase family 16 protein [Thermoanaerobaculia bacterium]|nr:glycoside hydrolase family 16 protein [Thermoanaerobaculia bacterium]
MAKTLLLSQIRWGVALLVPVLLCGRLDAQIPPIEITSIPAYGSQENLRGRVSNVDPGTYHVAAYLFLEGLGWYVKPTLASPCTSIAGNGEFVVDVTTGGVDNLAHRYAVFLLPASDPCPLANGVPFLPDELLDQPSDLVERTPFTLQFSGYTWVQRNSPYPGGPESNCFSPEHAFVDGQGQFHLTLASSSCGGEVWLARSLGYGEYRIHTIGRIDDLDPQAVFGLFTWDPDAKPSQREMDIELSRWGVPGDPLNAQFVLQPFGQSGNRDRFPITLTDGASELTFLMLWEPGMVTFSVYHGHHFGAPPPSDLIHEKVFTSGVPEPGRERFRFNLWRFCGSSCTLTQDQETVVTHFSHVPIPLDLHTVTPCRMVDTRLATSRFGGPALVAGTTRLFRVTGACPIPPTARAVSLNITVTQPDTGGNLLVYPAAFGAPLTSSINYSAGQTRSNNAILAVGDFEHLAVRCAQAAGNVHLIVDVNGYFE